MKPNWQKFKLLIPAFVGMAFCCQCQTTEEAADSDLPKSKFGRLGSVSKVGIKRESGYKFGGVDDQEIESGKKSEAAERLLDSAKNEKVIKNSKGEVVRKEQRGDLYADNEAFETNRAFGGQKEARVKESKFAQKDFKTPEYLKLQEFNGSKSFRDGTMEANESNDSNKLFSGKFFKTETSSAGDQSARENGAAARRSDKTYGTGSDRNASRAMETPAIPTGVAGVSGYRDLEMSMDDVKKLINPASAR